MQHAAKPRIHTFLSTSDIHLEHQFRMTPRRGARADRRDGDAGQGLCERCRVLADGRDALRPGLPARGAARSAIEAGATTLNIPDTVGYTTPDEYGALIAGIREHVPGADKVIISVHCHDDLGMAMANTLAGVRAGARQVEVHDQRHRRAGRQHLARRGRDGAADARRDFYGVEHADRHDAAGADQPAGQRACTGIAVQPNKAIVGANAFAHEAGIHQDGMLKNRKTYEIMRRRDGRAGWHTRWCSASTPAGTRSATRLEGAGLRAERRGVPQVVRALQGAGRQEEADRRPRYRGADRRRGAAARADL